MNCFILLINNLHTQTKHVISKQNIDLQINKEQLSNLLGTAI